MDNRSKILAFGNMIPEGPWPLHSRFRNFSNFCIPCPVQEYSGSLVCGLTDNPAGASPLNIMVSGLPFRDVEELTVNRDSVRFGDVELAISEECRFNYSLPEPSATEEGFTRCLAILEEQLMLHASEESLAFLLESDREPGDVGAFIRALRARVREGSNLIMEGKYKEGTVKLRGAGKGLTPSGDDFLAGCLYAFRLTGQDRETECRTILDNALGGNIYSNTALVLAYAGAPFASLKILLSALLRGETESLAEIVQHVLSLGHTSGADLLTGLVMLLRQIGTTPRSSESAK